MTQIVASLATPYALDPPDNYVLLIDEIGERPYRVDRMLTQLIQSGLLSRAVGIVCAEFPDCSEPTGLNVRSVISERLVDFPGPILFGFPTGHTAGPLWTVPLGVTVNVVTGGAPGLIFEESAVR